MKNLLLLTCLFLTAFVYGCGSNLVSKETAGRNIVLQVPDGLDHGLFWNEVSKKNLFWQENGSSSIENFSAGALPSANSLAKGGRLSFEGRGNSNQILVTGSVVVGASDQQIIIPLQRVF